MNDIVWALRDDYQLKTGLKLFRKEEDAIQAFTSALYKALDNEKNIEDYVDGTGRTVKECIKQKSFYDGDSYYLTLYTMEIN